MRSHRFRPPAPLPFPDLASRVLVYLILAWVIGGGALAIGVAVVEAVRS